MNLQYIQRKLNLNYPQAKKFKEQAELLGLFSVIRWVSFSEQEPPDRVEYYITYDDEGNIRTLEWYEGDCFMHCGGGHWRDEDSNEVTNVIYWAEKPCL